jgi:hypothetical protein
MAKTKKNKLGLDNFNEEDKTVWDSVSLNKALDAVENGYQLSNNPFYEKDINYRKPDLLYQYNDFEFEELKKCAADVMYFANNYAYTMTDAGVQQIRCRDYQEEVLNIYQNNRQVCFMASRQIGKCLDGLTKVQIYDEKSGKEFETTLIELYCKNSKISMIDFLIFLIYLKILKHF